MNIVATYMADADHDHHVEYKITPIEFVGSVGSVTEFIASATSSYYENMYPHGKIRCGRPPQNAANWIIVRMPDGTWLSDDEAAAYEQAAVEEVGQGAPIDGLMNWHQNRLTGASDANLLVATFDSDGRLHRDRHRHPVRALRCRMDAVTDALNILRKEKRVSPILTMPEIQAVRRQERGDVDVVQELARLKNPPRKAAHLVAALAAIRCEVSQFLPHLDRIAVKKPRKKKFKKYGITWLLSAVYTELMQANLQHRNAEGPLLVCSANDNAAQESLVPLALPTENQTLSEGPEKDDSSLEM